MKTLSAGIIGCGRIARSHLAGYKNNNVIVKAVADSDLNAARNFAAQIDNSVRCYDNIEALLDQHEVDMISICSPPVAHEQAAAAALARGIHVLCEKPLAHTTDSARRIFAAAQKSRAVLMTAFRHRFLPAIGKIKELLDTDAIGAPVFFSNVFAGPAFEMEGKWFTRKAVSGGGCLFDTSIHSVDLFRYFFGEVVEQHAVMHKYFSSTDVEDAGIIVLKAESGPLASLISSFVAGVGQAFISVVGQKGEIYYDYINPERIEIRRRDKQTEVVEIKNSTGHPEQIAHFIGAINGRHALTSTAEDGLRAVEIIQSVYPR
ncbi:MAG: Gfo/Idh/MocA family oxidoreductase [Victivallaceae bacterium]|nr:Gfo/Idh/MocA family oxidoreductase [Victivallaceae bacterium]